MGKVEDMRAMKQQRRAALEASASAPPARPAARTPAPVRPPAATAAAATPVPTAPDGQLCGHRSLGSRTCTRPAGHAEKNHRYAPAERPTG